MKLLLFSFLVLQVSLASAETLAQLRTRVDTWLAGKWPAVTNRQETFRANNGRYWQGLLTHNVMPAHTTSTPNNKAALNLASKPTDQNSSWLNVFPEWDGELMPCAVRVDVYGGPQGQGWQATVYARFNGTIYSRTQQVGPETWRTKAWAVFNETPPL